MGTVKSRTNTDCIIYTYADYLNRMLPNNHLFGSYNLWIANYGAKNNPPIPKGFKTWMMWQYSCKGQISGIPTVADMSMFNPSGPFVVPAPVNLNAVA